MAAVVDSGRPRPDPPLGPPDPHPTTPDLSPRGISSSGFDVVVWPVAAHGEARAPLRSRCVAGPRPGCVVDSAWCDPAAPVRGRVAGLGPDGFRGGGRPCVSGAPRGGGRPWLLQRLDCCGILAPMAARARLCAGDGAWPCSVYASAMVGPSGCGAMIFVVVSTFDGVGGVMVAWPEATCLGGC
jgi:hypothetical protein